MIYHVDLQETEAGDAFLDAINESELRPLADQVTIFVPSNDAFNEASAAFGETLATSVDRLVDVRSPTGLYMSPAALPRGQIHGPRCIVCSNSLQAVPSKSTTQGSDPRTHVSAQLTPLTCIRGEPVRSI